MSLNLTGLSQTLLAIKSAGDELEDLVQRTLEQLAFEVLKEAKEKVPVDTGFLQSSGKVEDKGDAFRVVFEAKYAQAVHEDLTVEHPNGQAKFLENAVEVVIQKDRVRRAIANQAGGLFG